MANKIAIDGQARFLKGVQEVKEIVGGTMGPGGGAIRVATSGGDSVHLRDGLKAAAQYIPKDLVMRLAADCVVSMAAATVRESGDGSSHTVVMAEAMYSSALELLEKERRWDVIRDLKASIPHVNRLIDEVSVPVIKKGVANRKLVKAVVETAVNGDVEMASKITELCCNIGMDGSITMAYSPNGKWETEHSRGMIVEGGVGHISYLGQLKSVSYDQALVVMSMDVIDRAEDLEPFLRFWDKQTPLVLVCPQLSGNAHALFVSRGNGVLPMVWVKCERDAGLMADFAKAVDAVLFDKVAGKPLSEFKREDYGVCRKVSSDAKRTSFVLTAEGAEIAKELIEGLSAKMEAAPDDNEQNKLKARIFALNGAIGTIRIPAQTDSQYIYLQELVEDGYRAAFSSMKDGVMIGGGESLDRIAFASEHLPAPTLEALRAIRRQVYGNVSLARPDYALAGNQVLDARTGDVVDAFKWGILDCAHVAKTAYKNACLEVCAWLNTTKIIEDEI